MKILSITKHGHLPSPTLLRELADHGIELLNDEAAGISAFTSMTIARTVNKQKPAIVLIDSLTNAIAAVSARKIAKENFKIICAPSPNSSIPTGIAKEIRQGVDAWIFASQKQKDSFPPVDGHTIIIPRIDLELSVPNAPVEDSPLTIAWIGPIDGNKSKLIMAIEKIDECKNECSLIICGTAKAQNVMPAVHRSRAIDHSDRIAWTGEKYDLEEVVGKSHAIIQAGDDPAPEEVAMCSTARPLIQPEELIEYIEKEESNPSPIGQTFSPSEILNTFVSYCHEIR